MERPTLSEIIEGRLISGDSEIVPTEAEPVRAVDVLGACAAVFRVSIDESGTWYAACGLAVREGPGAWRETGSGGCRGQGWEVRSRPSMRSVDDTISVFGSAGMDLPDELGRAGYVRGIYGFVNPNARYLRFSAASGERTVEVRSPAGAFVVLARGESAVEVQAVDQAGDDLAQLTFPAVERRRRLWRRS